MIADKIQARSADPFFAALTDDKWLALLYPEKRNEKQANVMVDPFSVGLIQPTDRTSYRVLVQGFCSGRYAGDNEKH
jgi:hypothetical protein